MAKSDHKRKQNKHTLNFNQTPADSRKSLPLPKNKRPPLCIYATVQTEISADRYSWQFYLFSATFYAIIKVPAISANEMLMFTS